MENSTESFKQRRLNVCKACSQSQHTFGVGLTCGPFARPVKNVSCGCKLTWKTALKGQECPQKKWADIKISSDEDKSTVAEGVD
jgi:hypothetical protein